MKKLSKLKCAACEGVSDRLSKADIKKYMSFVKAWTLFNNHHIEKVFRFKDFKQTLKFVNAIGKIAEKEGHHPNIDFTYGEATIKLWTHNAHGLSINDFILAAKIDEIK